MHNMCFVLLYNMKSYLKKCTSNHKETSAQENEIPWLTYFANLLLLYWNMLSIEHTCGKKEFSNEKSTTLYSKWRPFTPLL